jgi:hypothetical protein
MLCQWRCHIPKDMAAYFRMQKKTRCGGQRSWTRSRQTCYPGGWPEDSNTKQDTQCAYNIRGNIEARSNLFILDFYQMVIPLNPPIVVHYCINIHIYHHSIRVCYISFQNVLFICLNQILFLLNWSTCRNYLQAQHIHSECTYQISYA